MIQSLPVLNYKWHFFLVPEFFLGGQRNPVYLDVKEKNPGAREQKKEKLKGTSREEEMGVWESTKESGGLWGQAKGKIKGLKGRGEERKRIIFSSWRGDGEKEK